MSMEKSNMEKGMAQTDNCDDRNDDVQRQDSDVQRVGETTYSTVDDDHNETIGNMDKNEDNANSLCAQCSELQKGCDKYKWESKRLSSKVINDNF